MDSTLRELRRAAGHETQESFAMAAECTRDAVAQWEIGAAYPRAPMLPKLAAILNVTEGEIIAAITTAKQNDSV